MSFVAKEGHMKENIHPQVNEITIRCSCGNEIQTLSTMKELTVSICSACHPFFTGKQKILDTAGRVEKYKNRYAQKAEPVKKGPRTVTIS